ncbi:unnamed protein product [Urochloa decumbens]|uniref:HMA domain-containing protein n=1 Tax=Urochloa decumbens TaxID=240449 RepID=A0ABC8YU93_9POAL
MKIVLKVAITCKKCRTCVLGISSKKKGGFIFLPSHVRPLYVFSWSIHAGLCDQLITVAGIKSLTYDDEKSTLTVVGEVDVVEIVAALRKHKHPVEVVSVTDEKKEAEEKKKKEEEEKKKKEAEEKKKKEEEEAKKKCCCPMPCQLCPPPPCPKPFPPPPCPPPPCLPPMCPPPYMKQCQPCYIPIEDEYPGPCTIL